MMAFAKHNDGRLYRDEVTDSRLLSLFEDADTNHSGVVTKEQLIALAAKLDAQTPAGGNFGGPDGPDGPGGPGGPGGRGGRNGRGFGGPGGFGGGPGGPGGFGGPGGRGPGGPGRIIPPGLEQMLNLTPEQQTQVEELQKDVNAKLAKILTPEQSRQLQEFRGRGGRGPGGFGGPGGGPGGFGGPGGPDGFGGGPGGGPRGQGPGGPGGAGGPPQQPPDAPR
jgi:hypothetical protein